jgi:hypothetical protein
VAALECGNELKLVPTVPQRPAAGQGVSSGCRALTQAVDTAVDKAPELRVTHSGLGRRTRERKRERKREKERCGLLLMPWALAPRRAGRQLAVMGGAEDVLLGRRDRVIDSILFRAVVLKVAAVMGSDPTATRRTRAALPLLMPKPLDAACVVRAPGAFPVCPIMAGRGVTGLPSRAAAVALKCVPHHIDAEGSRDG